MKLIIESTTKIVKINGVPARIWEGHTDSGIAVHCMITGVCVPIEHDQQQFQHELQECQPPSAAAEAIPLRLVI